MSVNIVVNEDDRDLHDYTVHYPSGASFAVRGRTAMVVCDDPEIGNSPALIKEEGEVVVLDPRAFVTYRAQKSIRVALDPRGKRGMARWAVDWLAANPNWPPRIS